MSFENVYGFDIAGNRLSVKDGQQKTDEDCEECLHFYNHNGEMCRRCSPRFHLWFPADYQSESFGIKQDKGKLRLDLIDPLFEEYLAIALGYGAAKYGENNWLDERKGRDYTTRQLYASLRRHLLSWYLGEEIDPESGNPHLAHAAAMLQFLIRYSVDKKYEQFDDRPYKQQP